LFCTSTLTAIDCARLLHPQALAAALAPRAKAVRDGQVKTIDAADLVPGDVIIVRLGDVVPADIKVLPEEGGGAGDEVPLQVSERCRSH
jgi:H+-transporting ATPase